MNTIAHGLIHDAEATLRTAEAELARHDKAVLAGLPTDLCGDDVLDRLCAAQWCRAHTPEAREVILQRIVRCRAAIRTRRLETAAPWTYLRESSVYDWTYRNEDAKP